ncbi:N-acetyltransferase [Izhakiella australiensis]|uniref:N-acetyltransferase n=1 Tax=Izhakiella australiensis TaxID=1926881 RepID=A0A1S8YHU8_9GAMM|nr:GNAT family N-acetyltransferase [Izhakiella australiensis]OON38620.1 N-acetyltransferase [Izhakiella australiensis]
MHTALQWHKDRFLITTDVAQQDVAAIHRYLTRSSWAAGIDLETVQLAIANSLNFGLFDGAQQIGFARFVTDYATFAYLCDVYVLEKYQGEGLGRWLVACCQAHPVCEKLRRMLLFTTTAPWLYQKFGYQPINRPDYAWTITRPDIYQLKKAD